MKDDAKWLELVKKQLAPGQELELVKETDWSYVYKTGEKSYFAISKFLADETYAIPAMQIRQRWPAMGEDERLDFALNFWSKANWTSNDTEILEIIMADGDDRLWQHCAQAFLKHPDRERAVSFLIQRMEKCASNEPLNYIQALGLSKDRRAIPAIKPYYEKYRKALDAESITGVPEDVVFGPIPYHAYLVASGALLQIEGSEEYDHAIRKYLDHPHPQVRSWAKNALTTDESPSQSGDSILSAVLVSCVMRIIAGKYRSRLLKSLKGLALRPSSDQLRETLFNVLRPAIAGARFVDVFAGTGAVGIEALSRGAFEVTFIENHRPAAALIRRNLESLGISSGATVLAVDAIRGLEVLASSYKVSDPPIDYVFLDPPYAAAEDYTRVLNFLAHANFLAPNATIIAEHHSKFVLPDRFGSLYRVRILKQGDASLTFFREKPPGIRPGPQ